MEGRLPVWLGLWPNNVLLSLIGSEHCCDSGVTCLALFPKTNSIASITFDLPLPLGPTTEEKHCTRREFWAEALQSVALKAASLERTLLGASWHSLTNATQSLLG